MHGQMGKETVRQMKIWEDRLTNNKKKHEEVYKDEIDRLADRQTGRHANIKTDKEADMQRTDRQTNEKNGPADVLMYRNGMDKH
jgi:hypothetical protein